MIGVWCFNQIPGAWDKWTLAVFAVSEKDARAALKAHYHGGKLVSKHLHGGTIKADCGLTTEAASEEIRRKNEQETF